MDFASLQTRFQQRDRQALSRLLTLAARGEELAAIRRLLAELPPPATGSRVIAVTGSAGVGKSTLVGKLIEALRNQGRSVAVLACDPQSPLTGGALLGDRFRMPNRPDDAGVFIRSLATPGEHGAIAEHVELMVRLLSAFGFQWVILETVGAGQGDTAVRTAADQVVLLLQPEAGDDIQWEKAGVLEVADVVVIHKADLPGADRVEAQVRSLLNLPGCREVPVLRVSSQKGEGIADLISLVEQAPSRPCSQEPVAELRLLVLARLRELVDEHRGELADLAGRWQTGALSRSAAVEEFVRLLANGKA